MSSQVKQSAAGSRPTALCPPPIAMSSSLITLMTDFGSHGPYVAEMKGVILGINPQARLLDITHQISAQNIREAAFALVQVVPYFPPQTIHVVVVDPGVGTERKLLCVRMHDQLFLAPDNGVLSWVAREAKNVELFEIRQPRFWRSNVSDTFHGRDILAPLAAHLTLGEAPEQLGPRTDQWTSLPWPSAVRKPHRLEGEVLAVDRFGNLLTNLRRQDLVCLRHESISVQCSDQNIGPLMQTYGQVEVGKLLAVIGSNGFLEIALRNGNAARQLDAGPGSRVVVQAK